MDRYRKLNKDLPARTATAMGVAAVRPYFPKEVVRTVYGQLPRHLSDPAWFWGNAVHLAGLGWFWPKFRQLANDHSIYKAAVDLRTKCSKRKWRKLLRRAGKDPRQSKVKKSRARTGAWVWTLGGRWHRSWGGFTTILVKHEHVTGRAYTRRWQHKLGERGVRVLERELMSVVNPERMFPAQARWAAMDYVRRRLPELLHDRRVGGLWSAAWVMQGLVPTDNGVLYIEDGHVLKGRGKRKWAAATATWRD